MRTRWIVAGLTIVGYACLVTLGFKVYGDRPPPPLPPPEVDVRGAAGSSIVWLGDTLLGDAAQPLLDQRGYSWPLDGVRELIDGSFVIANAEAPITTLTGPSRAGQRWDYNAEPASASALAGLGVGALALANNHSMDRGAQGLADTVRYAREAGLVTVGAGMTAATAELPLMVRTSAGTVGIVVLAEEHRRDLRAGWSRPGAINLERAAIRRGYGLAKAAGADWVVGFVHWGENYTEVIDRQRLYAREFSRAGFDLVVGTGPHMIQPIDLVEGMPVVYSIGNFVFGTPGRFAEQHPGFGLVLKTTFTPNQKPRLQAQCIVTDNEVVNFQPRLCNDPQSQQVLTSLNAGMVVSAGLGELFNRG